MKEKRSKAKDGLDADQMAADCANEPPREQTYAEAKRLAIKRGEYLAECTERMRRIRALGS